MTGIDHSPLVEKPSLLDLFVAAIKAVFMQFAPMTNSLSVLIFPGSVIVQITADPPAELSPDELATMEKQMVDDVAAIDGIDEVTTGPITAQTCDQVSCTPGATTATGGADGTGSTPGGTGDAADGATPGGTEDAPGG